MRVSIPEKPPLMRHYSIPEDCDNELQTLAVACQVMQEFNEEARWRAIEYLKARFCANMPF